MEKSIFKIHGTKMHYALAIPLSKNQNEFRTLNNENVTISYKLMMDCIC
jgi:hypothetical protein